MLELTNAERAKAGCRPLRWRPLLATVASAHSVDMATHNLFSHTGSDGSSPFDRMTRAGYRYSKAAENIAAGYATAASVVAGWMKSPGHRANILDCSLTETGVGVATRSGSDYGTYWTQDFGTP